MAHLMAKYWYGNEGSTLFTIQRDVRQNIFKGDTITINAYYGMIEKIAVEILPKLIPPPLNDPSRVMLFYALSMNSARDLEQLCRVGVPYIINKGSRVEWDADDIKRVFQEDKGPRKHVGDIVYQLSSECEPTDMYDALMMDVFVTLMERSCEYCNKWFDRTLMMCSLCEETMGNTSTHYCSVECQGKHWKESHREYHDSITLRFEPIVK
jgi:hypothetical protein